jgi:hypothetical protein
MVSPVTDLRIDLEIDGIRWRRVDSLEGTGPEDRVFTIRIGEDGTASVVFGDGIQGARPQGGEIHIQASYRAGGTSMTTDTWFRAEEHFPSVRFQQGRVLLDSDWNETHGIPRPFCGIFRGVVVSNQDPSGTMRLRVRVPEVSGRLESWALPCGPSGIPTLPPEGEMVWILFEGGDPGRPVWMGTAPGQPR